MPTYHYRCKNCSYGFSLRTSRSRTTSGLRARQRVTGAGAQASYSAVPIEFKGSGFYRTDGASKSSGK
ncbi:MAG: FmdB family zinc ribbon protein [Bifidobacterium pullorum]